MGEPARPARPGFLHGCGLLAAWAGHPHWRILATAFGAGEDFLAAWQAWKDDPQRPGLLHFVAVEAHSVSAAQLLAAAADHPPSLPLARQLADQWFGLLPGFHRMTFDDGRVLLTLCVGALGERLREQDFSADSVFLMQGCDLPGLKAIARLCRHGTSLAVPGGAWEPRVASGLAQCGFTLASPGATPQPALQATYAPSWKVRNLRPASAPSPGRCVVVGAGLAGAAAAASLARRGWAVTVLDAAAQPAAGASALPAGVVVAHQSPDDSLLSRLSRSGVRLMLQQARALLREGQDWQAGVLEHRAYDPPLAASDADTPAAAWSRAAEAQHKRQALLPPDAPAYWHEQAAWISPAALVRAWLAQPGICWRGSTQVARIVRQPAGWHLLDAAGNETARAALVVVAAAHGSAALLSQALPLQAVRGQVSWAPREPGQQLPPFPVNGNGYFVPRVQLGGGEAWLCGSSFDRGDDDPSPRPQDHAANLQRLRATLPAVAQQLAPAFDAGAVHAWTGIRCASADRRPLLGEIEPGLWVSTALGSRGLTFAVLCAELLAARVQGEPLPLPRKLAMALDVERLGPA